MPASIPEFPAPFDGLSVSTEALDRLVEAARGDPTEAERRGKDALASGALVHAAAWFQEALRLGPSVRVATRLAATHTRLGMLREAVRVSAAVLDADTNGYAWLQHGNASRYLGDSDAAAVSLASAWEIAEQRKDGSLAIATLCALGELDLDSDEPQHAVERFGRALGLSELAGSDAVTVNPLAGLAEGHARWRAPLKARELAERALERARRAEDPVGEARALLARGTATGRTADFEMAAAAALRAPHVPLWVRSHAAIAVRAARDGEDGQVGQVGRVRHDGHAGHEAPDSSQRRDAQRVAAWADMTREAGILAARLAGRNDG